MWMHLSYIDRSDGQLIRAFYRKFKVSYFILGNRIRMIICTNKNIFLWILFNGGHSFGILISICYCILAFYLIFSFQFGNTLLQLATLQLCIIIACICLLVYHLLINSAHAVSWRCVIDNFHSISFSLLLFANYVNFFLRYFFIYSNITYIMLFTSSQSVRSVRQQ